VDSIFGDIDFALIEYTSLSGRGILYLVEIANDATEHMRKDFERCGAVFISLLLATWGAQFGSLVALFWGSEQDGHRLTLRLPNRLTAQS
jgi:hypothetical protein